MRFNTETLSQIFRYQQPHTFVKGKRLILHYSASSWNTCFDDTYFILLCNKTQHHPSIPAGSILPSVYYWNTPSGLARVQGWPGVGFGQRGTGFSQGWGWAKCGVEPKRDINSHFPHFLSNVSTYKDVTYIIGKLRISSIQWCSKHLCHFNMGLINHNDHFTS